MLFAAPDVEAKLRLLGSRAPRAGVQRAGSLQDTLDVGEFKEVMGKRWRYWEGNEEMEGGGSAGEMDDDDIAGLAWNAA